MELFEASVSTENTQADKPETTPEDVTQEGTGPVPFPPHHPDCDHKACDDVFKQSNYVCVPVKVKPFAKSGRAMVRCDGCPVITPGCECEGEVDGSCEFTITQKLSISLPVCFGADVKVSPTRVQCGEVKSDCKPKP